jgi:hypothetical protein
LCGRLVGNLTLKKEPKIRVTSHIHTNVYVPTNNTYKNGSKFNAYLLNLDATKALKKPSCKVVLVVKLYLLG